MDKKNGVKGFFHWTAANMCCVRELVCMTMRWSCVGAERCACDRDFCAKFVCVPCVKK